MIPFPHDSDIAVVGYCPICGQGRQFVARDASTGTMFVYCEECESEWDSPAHARSVEHASQGKYTLSSPVSVFELRWHDWFANIINKGT
jgi:formate dehydrogenase maturation protein FdhE